MIDGVTNGEAIGVLERMVQFAGQRHRLIANNIANFDTPGYRPQDVSVAEFQDRLAEAVDERRAAGGHQLAPSDSESIEFTTTGIELHPQPIEDNILFHDGNDRDLERTMQDLVENFMTFRVAAEMLRGRFALINSAISERV